MRKIALVMVLGLCVASLPATPSLAHHVVKGECSDYDDGVPSTQQPFAECSLHLTCVWETPCRLDVFGEAEAAGLVIGKLAVHRVEDGTYRRHAYSCGPGLVRCQMSQVLVVAPAADIRVFCEAHGWFGAGAGGVRLDPTIGLIPSVYCFAELNPA